MSHAAPDVPALPVLVSEVLVRDEPDYELQVPRLASYRLEHPAAEIIYLGSYWQYILVEGNGMTAIVRRSLKELLDRLEELGAWGF